MTKTAALKQFESWHKANPKAPLITFHKRYNLALAGKPQPTKDAQDGTGVLPVSGDSLVGDTVEKINQTQNTEGEKTIVRREAKKQGAEGTLRSPASWHNVELLFDDCNIEMIAPLGGKNSARPVTCRGLRPDIAKRIQFAKSLFQHTTDAHQLELSLAEITLEVMFSKTQAEATVEQWKTARETVRDGVLNICATHRRQCAVCRNSDEFSEGGFVSALREFALK